MAKFTPGGASVKCGGTQARVSRCRDILSGMPIGIHKEQFGPASDDVDVVLPYRIRSSEFSYPTLDPMSRL